MLGLAVAAAAASVQGQVLVNNDIAVSTTWTANNVYNLQRQIYVLPGATLTIQAGTVIASTTNLGGSLAVTRGAQIIVQGTEKNPVIFTSEADRATWTGGNPKTGSWREAANEWGNLTLMGRAYVSSCVMGNTAAPNANNVHPMEGLVAAMPGDPNVLYGGGNDDDDSGTIGYVSLRYAGKVIGLGNELNGLSLGGIGRETDIHHVEIMNNVDDGVEIWGGTVNLKYFSIWNVGDDSLDIDQGWRGKAQFGLLVQGYSVDAVQGSGVGDNCIETDGAEGSDYQPVTTGTIYNLTVIGQPTDGDHGTAWRDNCRLQYRNSIFMDLGERVVGFDNNGDHSCGALGYGATGTLSWAATWTTPYTAFSTVNAPANPAAFYRAQTSGNLAEITDSVFYNNLFATAYTEAVARGVFAAANNNVREPANSPIRSLTRGPAVVRGTKIMLPVTQLDPRPANDALTSVGFAPRDGFFSGAKYRGAFTPGISWLTGWTASEAFGFTPREPWADLGQSLAGTNGAPELSGTGTLATGSPITFTLRNANANAPSVLVIGTARLNLPLFGGVLVPSPDLLIQLNTDGAGGALLNLSTPAMPSGTTLYLQHWVFDLGAPSGLAVSNAVAATKP
jgi:hypothetical protein